MVTAFILVSTNTGKEKEVLDQLLQVEGIIKGWIVYGDYDIIAEISTTDLDTLNNIIFTKIRNMQNIALTSTLIGL